MLVKDVMSSPPVTVRDDMPLDKVARLMMDRDIGCVIVVDHAGGMAGVITESDFTGVARCVPFSLDLAPVIFGARAATMKELEHIYSKARTLPARQAMSEAAVTCKPSDSIAQVVHLMLKKKLKHVPVLDGGKPVGMVARHDLLKLLALDKP